MLDSLTEGRKLYVSHCGNCHNLYLPEQYTAGDWDKNVTEMQNKAKISESQKANILSYLKSWCKTPDH